MALGREARPPLREGEGETEVDMKELGHVCREGLRKRLEELSFGGLGVTTLQANGNGGASGVRAVQRRRRVSYRGQVKTFEQGSGAVAKLLTCYLFHVVYMIGGAR